MCGVSDIKTFWREKYRYWKDRQRMETLPKCRHYDSFKTMWNVENYIKRALFVVERTEWRMKMTKHRLRTEENQDGDDCALVAAEARTTFQPTFQPITQTAAPPLSLPKTSSSCVTLLIGVSDWRTTCGLRQAIHLFLLPTSAHNKMPNAPKWWEKVE